MRIKKYILKKLQIDFQFSKIIKREELKDSFKTNSRFSTYYNDKSNQTENFHRPICKMFTMDDIDFKEDLI